MEKYHKIQSVFKRDEKTHKFIEGVYSRIEFEYLKNNIWLFSEKVDGMNIRVGWDLETVKIGGRTDNAQIHVELIDELNRLFPVEKFKEIYPETPMTLYGEGYGAGIQKGGKYIEKKSFVLFDILIDGFWLLRENVEDIADKLNIKVTPIFCRGTLFYMVDLIKSKNLTSFFGDFLPEGIVARPGVELFAINGQRIITKIKHTDF